MILIAAGTGEQNVQWRTGPPVLPYH